MVLWLETHASGKDGDCECGDQCGSNCIPPQTSTRLNSVAGAGGLPEKQLNGNIPFFCWSCLSWCPISVDFGALSFKMTTKLWPFVGMCKMACQ
jgi:hypothetical protein